MLIHCPRCSASLPVWVIKAGDDAVCPSCSASLTVRAFPALLTTRPKPDPEDLRIEVGEASCFYHTSKRAASSCARCGRFVCALCAVDFNGSVWCPGCLANAKTGKKLNRLENRRVLWDSIALGTATLPMIAVWPAIPGSLAAIYISIRYWKRPSSLIPRRKWRFLLAILIALAEVTLFVILGYGVYVSVKARQ
jgi:uncharacterized paraquat-inducible protein A